MISVDEVRDLLAKLELYARMGVSALVDAHSIQLLLRVLNAQNGGERSEAEMFRIEAIDADQNCRTIGVSCDAMVAWAIFEAAAQHSGAIRLSHDGEILKERRPNSVR
jgi:hypothetical protein